LIEAVQSQPGASAASLFPDAARANRSIFYRDGRAATVGEVYANLTRGGGSGDINPSARELAVDEGFIRVASGDLLTRQQEQQALISLILNGTDGVPGAERGGRLTGSIFTSEMLKMLSDSRES
jgi:hypothetical protein